MIYVTVGNHNQPFDRLIAEIDRLTPELGETIIQTGYSNYKTVNAKSQAYFPFDEAEEMIKHAKLVVAHAGIGTIISARKWRTPLVICPRRKEFSEHINDHQIEICDELAKKPRQGVLVAYQPDDIERSALTILNGKIKSAVEGYEESGLELKNALKNILETI